MDEKELPHRSAVSHVLRRLRQRNHGADTTYGSSTWSADEFARQSAYSTVVDAGATTKPAAVVASILAAHAEGTALNRIASNTGIHHKKVSKIIDAAENHRRQLVAVRRSRCRRVHRDQPPEQIARHGVFSPTWSSRQADECHPAQPSHKVSDESNIGVSRRYETPG